MTFPSSPNPEMIIFTGPMFGGKTSRLLAALDRYQYQDKKIIAFKAKMDDRYSRVDLRTHTGLGIPAVAVSSGVEIDSYLTEHEDLDGDLNLIRAADVLAIDEVFMISGAAKVLIDRFRKGYTIIVSSLEMSAACNAFDEMVQLMPWATKIEKCPAVCAVCHQDAYYTHRKVVNDNDDIQVGGAELYEPRCWQCHSYMGGN